MRKRYHDKKESCGLCKPQKRGWAKRWKDKELSKLKEVEVEIMKAKKGGYEPNNLN